MNENLRKLMLAAGYAAPELAERAQQLAELIVRECIDTVSDCSVEYCTRPQIVSEIKEHFGVEE